MPLTNDLSNLASKANAMINSMTANNTAITSMTVAGQTINSSGFGITSTLSNTFTIGTSAYFTSNGFVGIGTNIPSYDFHITKLGNTYTNMVIQNTGTGTNSAYVAAAANGYFSYIQQYGNGPAYVYSGGTSLFVGTSQASPLYLYTNAVTRATITSVGDVGVGTVNPGYKIHAFSSDATPTRIGVENSSNSSFGSAEFIAYMSGVSGTPYVQLAQTLLSARLIATGASNPLLFFVNTVERMRIETSGRVHIGTSYSAPPGLFKVNSSTDNSAIALVNGPSFGVRLGTISGTGALIEGVDNTGSNSYQPLIVGGSIVQFTIAGGEKARLSADGNFLVGSSSSNAGRIMGYNTTSTVSAGVYGEVASIAASGYYGTYGRTNVTSTYASGGAIGLSINSNTYGILGYWSGSAYWTLYGNGSTYISGTYQGSDYRLKENIDSITGSLEKIEKLRPVEFNWKKNTDQAKNGHDRDVGLIAQEVLPILPGVVREIDSPQVSKDVEPTLNNELGSFYTIEYTRLIPHLINAIQELKAEVDSLKSQLSSKQ